MPRAAPAQTAFNGGELSPLLAGRADIGVYPAALKLCRNFIPLPQGPVRNRPGTRYLGTAKSALVANVTRFVPFQFSQSQSYMLEFGNLYFRIWKNRAPVLLSGSPVEVVTPYTTAQLAAVQFVQSADVLYMVHPDVPPQIVSRLSDTSWTCAAAVFNDGPFLDENDDDTLTITPSAATGSITLTASSALFEAGHVGALFMLWATDLSGAGMEPWEPGKAYSAGGRVYQNGRIYLCATSGTSGTVPPSHEEGDRWDGKNGSSAKWTFESSLFGVVRITGFTSSTVVSATVLRRLAQPISGAATARWAEGAWSTVNGYPGAVVLFQDRLVMGGSVFQPDTVWFSGAGDYLNFGPFASTGLTAADLAISVTVSSQQVNRIRAFSPEGGGLFVTTEGNEFLLAPANNSEGLSPSNIRALTQTSYGSAAIMPVRAHGATLFVEKAGQKLREAIYDDVTAKYVAQDMTLLSEHITAPGIAWTAWAPDPHGLLWVGKTDGTVCGLVYERGQEVSGWFSIAIAGVGDASNNPPFVEWGAVIPSPDGLRSDLWLMVRRWVNGAARRYVEIMDFDRPLSGDIRDSFFVDCGITYSGASTSTISGLSHLEGQTVTVIADGAVHPTRVVASGAITLERAATKVHVGLFTGAELETLRIEAGSADGTAQGKTKRFREVVFRLYASAGGEAGRRGGELDDLAQRETGDPMSGPVGLYTGDVRTAWPYGSETEGWVYMRQNQALPMNVLAIYPRVDTKD